MLRQGPEHRFENGLQTLGLRSKRHVKTAGGGGNRFQCRLIQPRLHERSGLVLHKPATLGRWDWNEITARRTHAHRKYS